MSSLLRHQAWVQFVESFFAGLCEGIVCPAVFDFDASDWEGVFWTQLGLVLLGRGSATQLVVAGDALVVI